MAHLTPRLNAHQRPLPSPHPRPQPHPQPNLPRGTLSGAQAAQLVSDALMASPALVELRRLETAKEIADTLARSRNVTYLPSGGGQSLLLSVGQANAT